MKLRKLCAVALVATIGATTLGSIAANAEATTLGSTGTVTVTGGKLDPLDPNITDPEDPTGPSIDPEIPGIIVNPDIEGQDKGIIAVSDLDFGSIEVGTTTANAVPLELATGGTRGNVVAFADLSGSYNGYTITGALTSQFSNGTTTLTGATITYTNPLLATSGEGNIATTVPTSTVLSTDGGAQTFVTAATGEGSGYWTLEFGQSSTSENGTPGTDADSVQLTIPASVASAMTLNTYTATVTWTMGATA